MGPSMALASQTEGPLMDMSVPYIMSRQGHKPPGHKSSQGHEPPGHMPPAEVGAAMAFLS